MAGSRGDRLLRVLLTQRLLAPGSEWPLHRDGFARPARADRRGADCGRAEIHKFYATLDHVLPRREKRFDPWRDQGRDLFGAKHEALL